VHGYLNGVAIRPVGFAAGTLEMIGIMVSLFVLIALFSSLVITLRWPAARIVVRVAGSWIAAIGLLLLGWTLRQGPI
jgi:urease accessory protein